MANSTIVEQRAAEVVLEKALRTFPENQTTTAKSKAATEPDDKAQTKNSPRAKRSNPHPSQEISTVSSWTTGSRAARIKIKVPIPFNFSDGKNLAQQKLNEDLDNYWKQKSEKVEEQPKPWWSFLCNNLFRYFLGIEVTERALPAEETIYLCDNNLYVWSGGHWSQRYVRPFYFYPLLGYRIYLLSGKKMTAKIIRLGYHFRKKLAISIYWGNWLFSVNTCDSNQLIYNLYVSKLIQTNPNHKHKDM